MDAAPKLNPAASLDVARRVVLQEAAALSRIAEGLGADFLAVLAQLAECRGAVIVTGMGKAGLVGQKISATFCSTGTRSFFLHPAEAIHGDLGRVSSADKVLALSMSGATEELVRVLPSLVGMSAGLVAITSSRHSALGKQSRAVIELGTLREACGNGLAPSTSTTAMLALGDALALTLSDRRGFRPRDFAQFHPGGSLGRRLTRVTEMMRSLDDCRLAEASRSVRETFATVRRAGRRSGAVMIVDDQGKLVGVFTDSDLARLLERQADAMLNTAVGEVMTRDPIVVGDAAMMPEAMQILADHHISELPVVDRDNRPVGMIDITDVITWLPPQAAAESSFPTLLPFPRAEA